MMKFSFASFVFHTDSQRFEVCFESENVEVRKRTAGELYGERFQFSNAKGKGGARPWKPCVDHCKHLIKLVETRKRKQKS